MASTLGMARDLLLMSERVMQGNVPAKKITPPGFYLAAKNLTNAQVQNFDIANNTTGHVRDVKFRYLKRGTDSDTSTTASCDLQTTPQYSEGTMPSLMYRQTSVHFNRDDVRRFEEEASKLKSGVDPNMKMLNYYWDMLMTRIQPLLSGIERDLLADQAANWGVNAVSGLSTARTLNFPLNTTNNALSQGIPMLLDDLIQNEAQLSNITLVGSGLINQFYMQQRAKGLDQSGVDTTQYTLPKLYYSTYSGTDWGSNKFGAFETGSLALIEVNKNVGSFSGPLANSWYGVLPIPVVDPINGITTTVLFDVQIREFDCEQTITQGSHSYTVGPGMQIILSKNYGLFHQPDQYDASDRLTGVNGSWLYTATNS